MIVKLAWRNVWRNKVRSLIVIIATMLGISGALFIAGLMTGMTNSWVKKQIDTELSEFQVHLKKFIIEEDQNFYFEKQEMENFLGDLSSSITARSYRLKAEGLAMSAHNSFQVILMGVNPEDEKTVTNLKTYLKEGEYFKEQGRIKQILISRKLAEELKVKMNSKIVINLSDLDGEIIGEAFKVVGIYKTGNGPYDQGHVFVLNSEFRNLLKMEEDQYHELALRVTSEIPIEDLQNQMKNALPEEYLSESWQEMQPALKMTESYMDTFSYILLSVVLIALIFGIINTMLMVVLERSREIGMLRSLGLNDRKVGMMFILETIYLSITGAIFGNIISWLLIRHFGNRGIYFEAWEEGFESFGYESTVFPMLETNFYFTVTLLVLFTALLASYFPVRKAIRLDIATAIRN